MNDNMMVVVERGSMNKRVGWWKGVRWGGEGEYRDKLTVAAAGVREEGTCDMCDEQRG